MALSEEELRLLDGDITGAVDPNAQLAKDNLVNAADGNPDQFAADRRLGLDTDTDPDMVSRNRPQVEKLKYLDDLDLQALDETPKTKQWVENGDNARISFDDVQVLQNLERESNRSWYEAGMNTFEGLGDSMMIGMGKTYDQASIMMLNEMRRDNTFDAMKLGQNPMGYAMSKIRDSVLMAMEGEEGTDAYNAELDKRIESHKLNLEAAEHEIARLTPQNLTLTEEGLRGGLQLVADMAPGLAVSIGTRGKFNPTLYMLTGKTYLDSYGSAIVAGKDNETAQRYATIDAALEFATEKLPMKQLEKIVGDLGGGGIKGGIKKWLITEATGEQIATATQSLNAYAFELDEELAAAQGWQEVAEIQGRRQAVTFISTLTGGGGMAAGMKGVDYLANREARAMGKLIQKTNKIRGSEFEQERLDNMIYLAQASKTNERAAEQFETFLSKAAPDQVIFLSSEGVDLLTNPPGYILDQMDGSGGDVQIPLATFLKDFANDETNLELVRPFIKTNEGLSSKTELEQDNDGEYIKSLLAKAAEAHETQTAAEAIYERITGQLIATGRQSTGTARQSAAIITAQVTTQYEYLQSVGFKKEDGTEVTLEDLFADFGLEIVGPSVDVGTTDFMTQGEMDQSEFDMATAAGLDMSPGGRQTRATEQGFDPSQTLYHGTTQEFSEFNPDAAGRGATFLGNTESANNFIQNDGEFDNGGRVMPVHVRGNMKQVDTGMSITEQDAAIALAKEEGFDGIVSEDYTAVFDPANIRSTNSAFQSGAESGIVDEYANAAAKGLDMSLEGRMARAEEQGYTPMYHGSFAEGGAAIDEFKIEKAGLSTRQKNTTYKGRDGTTGASFFFTDNAQNASGYANLAMRNAATRSWRDKSQEDVRDGAEVVYPMMVKMGRTYHPEKGQGMKAASVYARENGYDSVTFSDSGDSPLNPTIRVDGVALEIDHRSMFMEETFPDFLDGDITSAEVLDELDATASSLAGEIQWLVENQTNPKYAEQNRDWAAEILEAQAEQKIWQDMADAWLDNPARFTDGRMVSTIYEVFNPARIRSVNAAFDPALAVVEDVPMDRGSRYRRAEEQGFDTTTPWYHGSGVAADGAPIAPYFLTSDAEAAGWFAMERGEQPNIEQFFVRSKKPLDVYWSPEGRAEIIAIANAAGFKTEDKANGEFYSAGIAKHSPYDGTNIYDLAYIPAVREALLDAGYDSITGLDQLSNSEIPITIMLDSANVRNTNDSFAPVDSSSPRVLAQQNFGNIAITETVIDEAGMPIEITESATSLWREQQRRQANLDALRRCFNG